MKVVWYYSHPASKWAKVNPELYKIAQEKIEADFVNLDSTYENTPIDAKVEEGRILDADVIVFQFPVHFLGIVPKVAEFCFSVFSKHSLYANAKEGLLKNKQIILVNTSFGGAKNEDHSLGKSFTQWSGLAKQTLMKEPKQFILGGTQKADTEKITAFVETLVSEIYSE